MGEEIKRSLASIQRIVEINTIEGADAIEVATVLGWKVVVKKGEFNIGDAVVYFEIDSFIPTKIASFLTKEGHEPKVFNGIQGERLRTIKLRGQISQGLILPITDFNILINMDVVSEGLDVTDELGIKLWEKPMSPAQAKQHGQAKGAFPHFIRKTDQERVQNIINKLKQYEGKLFEITIKLDGSSLTTYNKDVYTGVCSRNIDLKDPDFKPNYGFFKTLLSKILPWYNLPVYKAEPSNYWKIVKEEKINLYLKDFCQEVGADFALQGELIGVGIQKNNEGLLNHELRIFDIFNITEQRYLYPQERMDWITSFNEKYNTNIKHVPVLNPAFPLVADLDLLLAMADGESLNTSQKREGIVFKACDGEQISFKVISNQYLLKEKD